MVWRVLETDFGGTDTVLLVLTDGHRRLEVLADVELNGSEAVLRRLHILGAGPNTLGPAALLRLIRWSKEWLYVDKLRIEGAVRTSGAGSGRLPRAIDA
jgi:hypothetical protein